MSNEMNILFNDTSENRKIEKKIYDKINEILKPGAREKTYSEKLIDICLKPLEYIETELKKKGLYITQGILYVNSTAIPHDGRIAVYFGDKWGGSRDRKTNIEHENIINGYIFEDEGPTFKNILKRANKDKPSNFPMLLFQEDKKLKYPHISLFETSINRNLLDDPKKLWSEFVKGNIFNSGDNKTALDKFFNKMKNDYRIDIENEKQAGELLLNPLRIASKYSAPNLIYVYDPKISDRPGGLAFVANINKSFTSEEFHSILSDLQSFTSNHILNPIIVAEAEFFKRSLEKVAGKPYVEMYFYSDKLKKSFPLIDNIRSLNFIQTDEYEGFASKFYDPLKQFFDEAVGPQGKALRGYNKIAESIFITIKDIWNKIWNQNQKREANTISDYKKMYLEKEEKRKTGNSENILDVLYKFLDFENELKYLPSYREHFIHSFHVMCLGFWILCLKNNKGEYLFAKNIKGKDRIDTLKSWFIIGIFHDIGYPISRSEDSFKRVISDFISSDLEINISPHWGNFISFENFHHLLFSDKFNELVKDLIFDESANRYLPVVDLNRCIITNLIGRIEHGILSALILYHHIKGDNNYSPSEKAIIEKSIPAILLHHSYSEKYKIRKNDKWKINKEKYPLAYLLILCDTLSQLERSFEVELITEIEKVPPIKLYSLKVEKDIIYCVLLYDVEDKKLLTGSGTTEGYIEYYRQPQEVISPQKGNTLLSVGLAKSFNKPEEVKDLLVVYKY